MDSNWIKAALRAEIALFVVFAALVAGGAGRANWAVAALGAMMLLLLTIPSVLLLIWGRARSHVDFMSALVGSIFGKAVVVGVAVAVIEWKRLVPTLPFVFGMMGGWVASFLIQFVILKRTLPTKATDAVS